MFVLPRILLCLLACGLFTFVTAQPEDAARLPLQKGHTHDIIEVKWSPNDKLLLTYSAADGFLHGPLVCHKCGARAANMPKLRDHLAACRAGVSSEGSGGASP